MPWINENGVDIYKESMFSKNELPTWNELYNEWYLKSDNKFEYAPAKEINDTDLYWSVPKKLYHMALACNQFNKMIFEDGFLEEGTVRSDIESLVKEKFKQLGYYVKNEKIYSTIKIVDIQFTIDDTTLIGNNSMLRGRNVLKYIDCRTDYPVKILSFMKMYRKDMKRLEYDNRIYLDEPGGFLARYSSIYIMFKLKSDVGRYPFNYYITETIDDEPNNIIFNKIIDIFIKPYKEYFTEPIGWKDENGNLIEQMNEPWRREKDSAL